MRASFKKSTLFSLAALTCAALLFAAPFDAAMARGDGGGSSGGAGSGSGSGHGSGGAPTVERFFADPALGLRPNPRVIHVTHRVRRHSCAMLQADQDGLWGEDRSEFLSTCVVSWPEM
jgi:hypothetical protein